MEERSGGGAAGANPIGTPTYYRAKVYRLTSDGAWADKGTGHICVEYLEKADAHGLVVISEDNDGNTLLVHRISKEDIYQRSGEATIINWHDPEVNTDVAISFQEQSGCDHIWQQIKQVQKEYHGADPSLGRFDQQASAQQYEGPDTSGVELPAPEMGNLEEIVKVLSTTNSPFQREKVAAALLKPGYIAALLDIFKQCEDLEDHASLSNLYRIVKTAIMLNEATLLEELLKEDHVMDVVGALEHDPDFKVQQKHRQFLQSSVQFKEVVPISDPAVMAKIHQTYRIQYIKDVILPRALDDATYTTLSSLALFNNVEVVTALSADPRFLPELFLRLDKHTSEDPEWRDLVAFLQEFCNLARHLQPSQRQQLFGRLIELGLFNVITRIMTRGADPVKLKATDILLSITQHDVGALRDFLLHQPDHVLFSMFVRELTEGGNDSGLPEQTSELLKTLLDPETMETVIEKNEFVELFYDKYVNKLLQVIVLDKAINPDGTRCVPASLLALIVDLFCFFVQHHSYRVKYFVLRSHMIEKVLRVVRRREKWLACAGIRFLRTCITSKDDFYTRSIVKAHIFEPVMTVFFENGDRYNLLNSAVLDIVDYVRKENVKELINHLVESFGQRFEDCYYVDTFKALRLKYDQMHEPQPEGGATGPAEDTPGDGPAGLRGRTFFFGAGGEPMGRGSRRRGDERGLDKDEEDYFSSDDSEPSDERGHAAGGEERGRDRERDDRDRDRGRGRDRDMGRRRDTGEGDGPGSAGWRVAGELGRWQRAAGRPDGLEEKRPGLGPAPGSGGRSGRDGALSPLVGDGGAAPGPSPGGATVAVDGGSGAASEGVKSSGWRLVEYEDDDEENTPTGADLGRRVPSSTDQEKSSKAQKSSADDSPGRK